MSHHQLGYHYRFRLLEFWAERGMIHIIDERFPPANDRSYTVKTVRDFLLGMNAFSDELRRRKFKYADERNEYIKLLDDGVQACRDAKTQGRPDDPAAIAQIVRDRRKSMLYSSLPAGMRTDGGLLLDTFTGGASRIGGALAASAAPENRSLPPMPQAPRNKATTDLVRPDRSSGMPRKVLRG